MTNAPPSIHAPGDIGIAPHETKTPLEYPSYKETKIQKLKREQLAKTRQREEASTVTKTKKTVYVSKKRRDMLHNENGQRQVNGNSVTCTLPLNFMETKKHAAANKIVIDKGTTGIVVMLVFGSSHSAL